MSDIIGKMVGPEHMPAIRHCMERHFPPEERKPDAFLRSLMADGICQTYVFSRGTKPVGYALLETIYAGAPEEGEGTSLLDYFAVLEEERDQGVGSEIFQMFPDLITPSVCMMIEIENPASAGTAEEAGLRTRRRGFYLRNGAEDTGVRSCVEGMEYQILTLSRKGAPAPEMAKSMLSRLYSRVLPEQWKRGCRIL